MQNINSQSTTQYKLFRHTPSPLSCLHQGQRYCVIDHLQSFLWTVQCAPHFPSPSFPSGSGLQLQCQCQCPMSMSDMILSTVHLNYSTRAATNSAATNVSTIMDANFYSHSHPKETSTLSPKVRSTVLSHGHGIAVNVNVNPENNNAKQNYVQWMDKQSPTITNKWYF